MATKIEAAIGSGNIFADLGLPDAEERLAKAEMVRAIRSTLERRGLSQRDTATLLGLHQPDVSDLLRGKLARFSRERIERFVVALDMDVQIRITPIPPGAPRGRLTVDVVGR